MNVKNCSTSYAKCQSATVILNGDKCYLLGICAISNKEAFLENMAFRLSIEGWMEFKIGHVTQRGKEDDISGV